MLYTYVGEILAEDVLREIESLARERFLPIVGPRRGRILVEVVREFKPKRILEVGTLIGYSTILMGKELDSDAHIITIEINPRAAEIAMDNIRRAGIKPKVDVIVGDALKVIPKLEGEFDLVFIDADKDEYLDYLKLVEDKLHSGSVVVADNVFSAPSYLDYVRRSGKYKSRFISAGGRWDGLEVSIKL